MAGPNCTVCNELPAIMLITNMETGDTMNPCVVHYPEIVMMMAEALMANSERPDDEAADPAEALTDDEANSVTDEAEVTDAYEYADDAEITEDTEHATTQN